jgi:hypothetical protein
MYLDSPFTAIGAAVLLVAALVAAGSRRVRGFFGRLFGRR